MKFILLKHLSISNATISDSPFVVFREGIYDEYTCVAFCELIDSGNLQDGIDKDVIFDIAVHPKYRRKGYGKKLLQSAIAWFMDSTFLSLTYRTKQSNISSIKLAESCGLKRLSQDVLYSNIRTTDYVYIKEKKFAPEFTEDDVLGIK